MSITIETQDSVGIAQGMPWHEFRLDLSLAEFIDMRKRTAAIVPAWYSAAAFMLGQTATTGGYHLALAFGWTENGDFNGWHTRVRRMIDCPMATAQFIRIMTNKCRVTYVDGIKLKRRKHFKDQTYGAWKADGGAS